MSLSFYFDRNFKMFILEFKETDELQPDPFLLTNLTFLHLYIKKQLVKKGSFL